VHVCVDTVVTVVTGQFIYLEITLTALCFYSHFVILLTIMSTYDISTVEDYQDASTLTSEVQSFNTVLGDARRSTRLLEKAEKSLRQSRVASQENPVSEIDRHGAPEPHSETVRLVEDTADMAHGGAMVDVSTRPSRSSTRVQHSRTPSTPRHFDDTDQLTRLFQIMSAQHKEQMEVLVEQLQRTNERAEVNTTSRRTAEEHRRRDERADRRDEQARRVFQSLVRMSPGEDLYSVLARFERTMVVNDIDTFKWVHGLEYILEGRHLSHYFANVDSFVGQYNDLKEFLLNHGGFSVHDCVESVLNHYRPSGSLTATQWAMQASHKISTIWKHAPEVSDLTSSEVLKTLADTLASYFILAPMSREGRTCVFATNPATSRDRILAYENFVTPFKSSPKQFPNYERKHYDRKPDFGNFSYSNESSYSSYTNDRPNSSYSNDRSYHKPSSSYRNEHSEPRFIPTCYNCGERGHTVPRCTKPKQNNSNTSNHSNPQANNDNSNQSSNPIPSSKVVTKDKDQKVNRICSDSEESISDDLSTELENCSNLYNGKPKVVNVHITGSVNNIPCTFEVDSGACVSIVSPDLVPPGQKQVSRTCLKGLGSISTSVPFVILPVNVDGEERTLRLAVHGSLPSRTVLLGRDVGTDDLDLFINMARKLPTPLTINVTTRAQAITSEKENTLTLLDQVHDEGLPTSLSETSVTSDCIDCLDTSLPLSGHDIGSDSAFPLSDSPQLSVLNPNSPTYDHNSDTSIMPATALVAPTDVPSIDIQTPDHDDDANPISVNSLPVDQPLFAIPSIGFDGISKSILIELQTKDESLSSLRSKADDHQSKYFFHDGILMGFATIHGVDRPVVILPTSLRPTVLQLAHSFSGHFGIGTTRNIINKIFTWPNLAHDVAEFVKSCVTCQRHSKTNPPIAPLSEPEVISEHFEKMAMDVVGPLDRSRAGYSYILTAMDLATSYPFAYPMKGYTARETAENLLKIISDFGIPHTILTDQGTNFLSRIFHELSTKFAIVPIKTAAYHPQSNGQLERFHSTLKSVLRKCTPNRRDWPSVLNLAIFYLRNMPLYRSGYTPYELHFGRMTPNVLATLRSFWVNPEDLPVNVSEFMLSLQQDINTVLQGLKSKLKDKVVAKREKMDHAKLRMFNEGDLVLRKIPGLNSCLSTSWEGPYKVESKLSGVTYSIVPSEGPKRKPKSVHVNQLKAFVEPIACHRVLAIVDQGGAVEETLMPEVFTGVDLSSSQETEVKACLKAHQTILTNTPGATQSAHHSILVSDATPIWSPSFTIPLHIESQFKAELDSLLEQGIVEVSNSNWSSPPIPVRKKDGSIRIVVDYRKLNSITQPQPFYMPSTEEVIARLGSAVLLSKVDLAKGFHQIPMAEDAKKFTAFSCKYGKFQYVRMPFGLRNAPATFQLLMQQVLSDLNEFCEPYIDDVVIYSGCWKDHLSHIDQVLTRLKAHGLTIKPAKCLWGATKFEFLGYIVGEGKQSIPPVRVEQFRNFVRPKTKRQLRSFLGLCGYFRKFLPVFSDMSAHLTHSLTITSPNIIEWSTTMTESFHSIIQSICDFVVLTIPTVSDVFVVSCDASSIGVGGVLCVSRDDKELPVSFYSRQLSPREQKFAATELEALALLETVKHFAFYLFGRQFVVYTDHKAFEQFFSSQKLNNRLWRWRLQLLDFDFVIKYKPGKDNLVPDSLSRQGWITSEEEALS